MKRIAQWFSRRWSLLRMNLVFLGELGAVDKVLIRQWTVSINTGTTALPVWVEVGGVDNVSPSRSKNNADTGDFASAGWERHLPASRGRSLTVSGHYMEDVANGDRDPGQEAVETLGVAIGVAGIGEFKFESPGGNGFRLKGSVDITGPGGGKNDVASWGFVLDVDGQPTAL